MNITMSEKATEYLGTGLAVVAIISAFFGGISLTAHAYIAGAALLTLSAVMFTLLALLIGAVFITVTPLTSDNKERTS